jgi:hypothetical protein
MTGRPVPTTLALPENVNSIKYPATMASLAPLIFRVWNLLANAQHHLSITVFAQHPILA